MNMPRQSRSPVASLIGLAEPTPTMTWQSWRGNSSARRKHDAMGDVTCA